MGEVCLEGSYWILLLMGILGILLRREIILCCFILPMIKLRRSLLLSGLWNLVWFCVWSITQRVNLSSLLEIIWRVSIKEGGWLLCRNICSWMWGRKMRLNLWILDLIIIVFLLLSCIYCAGCMRSLSLSIIWCFWGYYNIK